MFTQASYGFGSTGSGVADASSGSQFTDLSGTDWNVTQDRKVRLTLTDDRNIVMTDLPAGVCDALLYVVQDGVGGRELSINGTPVNVRILAGSDTLVQIVDIGNDLFVFDTNFSDGGTGSLL